MQTATAHDALTDLTTTFTNAEIGEVLGVAPETVSRLKNEDRDPRGEVADRLDAFHYVFHRALSRMSGDRRAARWAIVRRQAALDGDTVVHLLRDLDVDRALEVLALLPSPEVETVEDLTVPEAFDQALLAAEQEEGFFGAVSVADGGAADAERFLDEHLDVQSLLPHLFDEVRHYLGPAEVSLAVAADEFDGEELVVQFNTSLPVEEASERMRHFYADQWDQLVAPYSNRLSIAVE